MSSKQHTELSKFLSYVLRHEPHTIGLTLDSQGWADIDALLACTARSGRQDLTPSVLQAIVETSDKKRFTVSQDGLRIRAAQGHSAQGVAIAHTQKKPPEFLFHGTATRFLASIRQQGLVAGVRHHVHLSQDMQTALAVGQRYGQPVVLRVEALRMFAQGFHFHQADNGVWLTEHVAPGFLVFD